MNLEQEYHDKVHTSRRVSYLDTNRFGKPVLTTHAAGVVAGRVRFEPMCLAELPFFRFESRLMMGVTMMIGLPGSSALALPLKDPLKDWSS